jgi:hypothetical protein
MMDKVQKKPNIYLYVLVVTICKFSINPITCPNPVHSQLIHMTICYWYFYLKFIKRLCQYRDCGSDDRMVTEYK